MIGYASLAVSLFVIAVLAVLVDRILTFHCQHLIGDEDRLRVAIERLQEHQEAVDRIMSHPNAEPELKRLICMFADAVMDHDLSRSLVHHLLHSNPEEKIESSDDRIVFEMLQHYEKFEDLRLLISAAIRNGMVGMVLQWTDTAKQMAAALSEIAVEPEPEVVGRAMAARRGKPVNSDSGFGFMPA
jgi:hypothetical protein